MAKESKNKSVKFGLGKYESSENRSSVRHLRDYFLQVVREVAPEVLNDLNDSLFEFYQQISALCYEAHSRRLEETELLPRHVWTVLYRPSWKDIENPITNEYEVGQPLHAMDVRQARGTTIAPAKDERDKIAAFREKMIEWSRRHNLNAIWCRDYAYETLDLWCHIRDLHNLRIWQRGAMPYKILELGPIDLLPH